LKNHSVVELAAAVFEEWGIDESRFLVPDVLVSTEYPLTVPRLMGLIVAQWSVTPREIYPVMDALRLFVAGWEHPEPIEPMALLSLIVHLVRGEELSFVPPASVQDLRIRGTSYTHSGEATSQSFSVNTYLKDISPCAYRQLDDLARDRGTPNAAVNYLREVLIGEWSLRHNRSPGHPIGQSHITDYIPRLVELARFIDQPEALA
jgi:hypothetical protein